MTSSSGPDEVYMDLSECKPGFSQTVPLVSSGPVEDGVGELLCLRSSRPGIYSGILP